MDVTADDKNEAVAYEEASFLIKVFSPGVAEPLEISVSAMELVQEIHQLLMDREETCHRTCFSLQLDGVTLDNFAELKSIENLQEGSVVKVIEEPYTMREARIHVRHIRDLLKSMDPTDAYNGLECYSLSFLPVITQDEQNDPKRLREKIDCTPPDYILPGTKERNLWPLQPGVKNMKGPLSVKVLTTSAWNPPPGPRKLHGDLMYLYVITMEDKRFHITACPRGFYINQSSEEVFNPKPDTPSHLCHSLIDLLTYVSPTFKRNFSAMQRRRSTRHPFERLATSYQVYAWCSPALDHTIDAIRAEDTFSSKLGYEEHIPGQTRDWNEELQTTRELARKTLPERLMRERAIFKVHSDFVGAATRGAMAVIDGNVMAINPGEDTKMQMFIWNNIFFSLGFDVREHYKDLGGDAAAFVAPRNDLHGVRVYNAVDVDGLYTLGTVVVDYRGYRVTAQSIIPGILEREQEQSVVYGSIDFGKTVLGNVKYLKMLKKAAKHLRIWPHHVLNEKNEAVELCSSVECKGIIGNDNRYYVLDLLRTFPPDANFLKSEDIELSAEVQALGFPIEHKHKLNCLRAELLDAFVDDRYIRFIRNAAFNLQQVFNKAKTEKTEGDASSPKDTNEAQLAAIEAAVTETDAGGNAENGKPLVNTNEARRLMQSFTDGLATDEKQAADSKNVVRQACANVGSLKELEFDIRFNPDVFSPVRHTGTLDTEPPADKEQAAALAATATQYNTLKQQRKLVIEAAEFLVTVQIPTFVQECMDHSSAPMDGNTLTDALHGRGINIRYLGKVANLLAKVPRLEYLHSISVCELILRATKHIFYVYMQNTDMMNLSSSMSHFLNCFLTTASYTLNPILGQNELFKSNKRGGGGNGGGKNKRLLKPLSSRTHGFGSELNIDWVALTQKTLWQQIKRELRTYYDFDLGTEPSIDAVCETFKLNKLSVLRAFCLKVGIQILLREYNFESKNKPSFNEEDIVNVFPIVKHINPRATDAFNFYTTGQTKIKQGNFKEGYELISESLSLLNHVYGAMHAENSQCLRMLARLSYIMGDPQEATAIQQRAVLMSERVNGIDHPYTISEYVSKATSKIDKNRLENYFHKYFNFLQAHLALYSFANGQIIPALRLLYRSRYLALLICGDNHPDMALLDVSIDGANNQIIFGPSLKTNAFRFFHSQSNIALILHAAGEFRHSLRFLEHALALNLKYFGEKSLKVAVSYHLLARTQSCMGDFRSALNSEKETYGIYKQLVSVH